MVSLKRWPTSVKSFSRALHFTLTRSPFGVSCFCWHSRMKSRCELTLIRLQRARLYLLRRVSRAFSSRAVSGRRIRSSSSMWVSSVGWADKIISGSGCFWASISDTAGLCVGSRSGSSALADPTPLLLMLSRASSA